MVDYTCTFRSTPKEFKDFMKSVELPKEENFSGYKKEYDTFEIFERNFDRFIQLLGV